MRMVSGRLRGTRHNAKGNYGVSERTPNLMARRILRELRSPWRAGPVAHQNDMKYHGKPQPFFEFNWSLWGRLGHSLGSELGPFRCDGAARKCRFDFLSFARAYESSLALISTSLRPFQSSILDQTYPLFLPVGPLMATNWEPFAPYEPILWHFGPQTGP